MKLTVFPSDHGDCLLLESADQRMLIDGGPGTSFKRHVLPYLVKTADRPLDCIYLSHIDHDHIGGLLVLLDALFAWAVYQYRLDKGKNPTAPNVLRPPEVRKVWHNGFEDMLPGQALPIAAALENTAAILSGLKDLEQLDATTQEVVRFHRDLATHAGHAMELQYRIGSDQLGIALNPEANGKLLIRNGANAPAISFGDVTFTLLGPTQADIEGLRKDWQKWLDDIKNEKTLVEIEKERKKDADALTNAAEAFIRPIELQARELVATLLTPAIAAKAEDLGKRGKVTPPNLASLMFLVEEGKTKKKRILLTGDGHAKDLIDGLEAHGKLSAKKKLHVNVLKVPHHGAEYNMTPEFARDITADHYVFCGNGYATNPEVVVLDTIVKQRANGKKGKYKFWFNCNPDTASYPDQMKLMRETVIRLENESNGRMTYEFIDEAFAVPL